jgi:hypothetical protein
MSNSKISALPASTVPLAGTEILPIVQSSTTKQVTVANLTDGRAVSALSFASTTGANFATTSGNVGIGTASPSQKLEVSSATNNTVSRITNTGSNFELQSNTNDIYLNLNGSGSTIFRNGTPSLTERMRLDASGNLGVGVTPSGWDSAGKINVPNSGALIAQGTSLDLGTNWYYNSGFKYATTATATRFLQTGGAYQFFTAASGTAGTAITFTQAMTLDSSGNLGIGTTSPSASAILDAQSTTKGVRMPNMTTTQKNAITSPATGLMVFDTTLAKLCVYSGVAWQTITSI